MQHLGVLKHETFCVQCLNCVVQVNTTRYPGGLEAYVKAINDLGLEAGLYLDAGPSQCCSRIFPGANDGSLGHEDADGKWMADLGFTWLKYDDCGSKPQSYTAMRDALNATGKHIVYSVHGPTGSSAVSISNLWRATPDINNSWTLMMARATQTSQEITAEPESSAPGSFAMADMLEAFNGTPESPGLTDTESRTHFAMWAALKSPLLMGFDVTHASDVAIATLTNPGIIGINQDPLGEPAPIRNVTSTSIQLGGRLSGSRGVIVLVNTGDAATSLTLTTSAVPGWPVGQEATLTDAWTGKELGKTAGGEWAATVVSHDHVAAILSA